MVYIYIYEHEAIRRPKSENNIGAPSAPQNQCRQLPFSIIFGNGAHVVYSSELPLPFEFISLCHCSCVLHDFVMYGDVCMLYF